MSLIQTEGIVIQSRRFSETSKILSIYTLEQGLVSILVKGGRKGQKKFPGGLETLNRVGIHYYHRPGRDLQNFKSFDLIESYSGVQSDLKRTYTALSLAETVLRACAIEDPNSELYHHLVTALTALDEIGLHPWAIRWKFLLNACRSLGFAIRLEGCIHCGRRENLQAFDLKAAGFMCGNHRSDDKLAIGEAGEIWGILRFLESCDYPISIRIAVSPKAGRRIELLYLKYIQYHTPGLRTLESWKNLPQVYWEEGDK